MKHLVEVEYYVKFEVYRIYHDEPTIGLERRVPVEDAEFGPFNEQEEAQQKKDALITAGYTSSVSREVSIKIKEKEISRMPLSEENIQTTTVIKF